MLNERQCKQEIKDLLSDIQTARSNIIVDIKNYLKIRNNPESNNTRFINNVASIQEAWLFITDCINIMQFMSSKETFTPMETFNLMNYVQLKGGKSKALMEIRIFRKPDYVFKDTKDIIT